MPIPAFDHPPAPYTGPTKAEVRALREQHVNPGIFLFYKEPIMIVEGKMQYLYDETGRRFLDAFGGIVTVSVGHCHPKVVAALNRQNELLQHTTTIYLHPNISEYSAKLAATLPGDLKVVYFTNSGSEANDLALLMARAYTESFDFLALRNCYHGGSQSTMGLTSHHTWKFNVPHSFGIHHAIAPDLYRGRWTDADSGPRYAEDIRETIRFATSGRIAGFIAESIQGVGGAVVFPDNYLKEAYRHVRDAGGLCVADEVQSGFGRTGSHYWGFETQGVIPDIVTMAKGIGNGFPLGAVVTTPEIAKTISARVHFNTYGGNPMACAQGKAVLEVIEEDGLQANALAMGNRLLEGLRKLQDRHPAIGQVRGLGLMLGVELVQDRESKTPAKDLCLRVFERAKDLGLLVGKGGLDGNVLRIKPPMCINQDDVDFILEVLDQAIGDA